MVVTLESKETGIVLPAYECEMSKADKVGDELFFQSVLFEFGLRAVRGSAIAVQGRDGLLGNAEHIFRDFLSREPIGRALEIGTWRGVSGALIAHYADHLDTIDVMPRQEPYDVWLFYGVMDKITQHIVPSNAAKAAVISGMDFDFAFVDAIHTFEGVAFDFECVKKCGRVLFHDYQVMKGVTEFIDTLPDEQVIKEYPFAYWKADGHSKG